MLQSHENCSSQVHTMYSVSLEGRTQHTLILYTEWRRLCVLSSKNHSGGEPLTCASPFVQECSLSGLWSQETACLGQREEVGEQVSQWLWKLDRGRGHFMKHPTTFSLPVDYCKIIKPALAWIRV